MEFGYQYEKFASARRILMLPHPRGEAESIAGAFHEISLALHRFDRESLDDNARRWVETIENLMSTEGLSDPNKVGLWTVKAELLSTDEKFELSSSVDELAHWFGHRFWGTD